tara:strand:+ start:8 stop:247 length:240 start_codon:yes stop_codon:yes gene_type:complete
MKPIDNAWSILKSKAYDGEEEGGECAICGNKHRDVVRPTGTGMMACTKPKWEDYEPGDGEGYQGHLEHYERCQRMAGGQ